jgi:hypothetical protein
MPRQQQEPEVNFHQNVKVLNFGTEDAEAYEP